MAPKDTTSQFRARPLRPASPGAPADWAFVVLPREASEKLPRRGRTTVSVSMNGHCFEALLEPDGRKSHWLRIEAPVLEASGTAVGDDVAFEVTAVAREPEPEVPEDLARALAVSSASQATWEATTTLARVDWIHWVTSAKQARTRTKRIGDACDMLAAGEKRVCCFDPSGFYSKAFRAPEPDDGAG